MPFNLDIINVNPRKLDLPALPRKFPDPIHMDAAKRVVEKFETLGSRETNGEYMLMFSRIRRSQAIARGISCGVNSAKDRNKAISDLATSSDGSNILEDCLPCLNRVGDFSQYNILEGFLDMFDAALDVNLGNLKNLLTSLLNNSGNANYICSLLNMLKGKCLPDIAAFIAMIVFYISDIQKTLSLEMISKKDILAFIVNMLVTQLLSGFGQIDNFLQMINSIVDCFINDINSQLKKVQIRQDIFDSIENDNLRTRAQNIASGTEKLHINGDDFKENLTGEGSILAELQEILQSAVGKAEAKIQTLIDFIEETLNLSEGDFQKVLDLIVKLGKVLALLNILKQIFDSVKDGGICSNPNISDKDKVSHFILANYPNAKIDDNIITIPTPEIPIPPELIDILGDVDTIQILTVGDQYTIKLHDLVIDRSQCTDFSGDQELAQWAKNLNL